MTLPPRRPRAEARTEGRWAAAALLALLALTGVQRQGQAQDADPYSATVKVDATADSVIKAREAARLDGQRRALNAIAERLAAAGQSAKVPKLDDSQITGMVASFEVANERMSAVRYLADYTFHFQPAAVQRTLRVSAASVDAAGKPPTSPPDSSGKPLVVLPVYRSAANARLWEDPNPWRDAWDKEPAAAGAALIVPLGDAGDIAALDAGKAIAGDAEAIASVAQHNGADEAIVALAAPRGPPGAPTGVDVAVRRYRGGQLVDSRVVPVSANPGENEGDLLRRTARTVMAGIAGGGKKDAAGYDQQGTLTAVLPIDGLDDWVRARERMAGVPAIRKVSLMALSRQEATIEIGYVGTIDQLKSNLAGVDLDLTPGGPAWHLARTGAGRAVTR
jgi:uncharacterized protein DUF2066